MKKRISFLTAILLLIIQGTQAQYVDFTKEVLKFRALIQEVQSWEGSGSSLHVKTGLILTRALLREPDLGNYNGIIRIPETVEFYGADYDWEEHETWHFGQTTLRVTGCVAGVFEHCQALKNVIFPVSSEIILAKNNVAISGFSSLGVSFRGCTSLLAVENMDLSWVFARQFEYCSSLKEMDLSKTTTIDEYAFNTCQSLEKITFKSNVNIKDYVFNDCNNIKKIYVNSGTGPESFNDNAFTQTVYEQAILVVPVGKVSRFKNTNGWKNFQNIYEVGSEPQEDDKKEGDLTGDGEVNGTDLVQLIEYVLTGKSDVKAADLNSDGLVNGTDLVKLVNIILGKE